MKKILGISSALLLLTSFVIAGEPHMSDGTVKATMDGNTFEAEVMCIHFDSDEFETKFMFITDNAKHKDIDGDGIVLRGDKKKIEVVGMKMNGIEIDLTLNGDFYESSLSLNAAMRKKEKWTKTDTGVKGEVKLIKRGDSSQKSHKFSYEVICK